MQLRAPKCGGCGFEGVSKSNGGIWYLPKYCGVAGDTVFSEDQEKQLCILVEEVVQKHLTECGIQPKAGVTLVSIIHDSDGHRLPETFYQLYISNGHSKGKY